MAAPTVGERSDQLVLVYCTCRTKLLVAVRAGCLSAHNRLPASWDSLTASLLGTHLYTLVLLLSSWFRRCNCSSMG
jgi:hypothetical protein